MNIGFYVFFTDSCKFNYRYFINFKRKTMLFRMTFCNRLIHCRKSRTNHFIKISFAFAPTNSKLQINIIRPILLEPFKPLIHRFYIDAAPAYIIKCFCYRVINWVMGTHINITALIHIFEGSMKHYVFKILGI